MLLPRDRTYAKPTPGVYEGWERLRGQANVHSVSFEAEGETRKLRLKVHAPPRACPPPLVFVHPHQQDGVLKLKAGSSQLRFVCLF